MLSSEKGKVITYTGDLAEGCKIYDMTWAARSSMACFPGTQNSKFSGNHIFFVTELPPYSDMLITLIPDDKKITDHHAIIPTGVVPRNLSKDEFNVYDAITRQFLAAFFPDRIAELFKVKEFAFIIVIAVFLIGFFVWLKLKNRD